VIRFEFPFESDVAIQVVGPIGWVVYVVPTLSHTFLLLHVPLPLPPLKANLPDSSQASILLAPMQEHHEALAQALLNRVRFQAFVKLADAIMMTQMLELARLGFATMLHQLLLPSRSQGLFMVMAKMDSASETRGTLETGAPVAGLAGTGKPEVSNALSSMSFGFGSPALQMQPGED
jgi:hypothetical protein